MTELKAIYIDTAAGLTEACATLAKAPVLTVDTEFHRESTYYPQFALLQIASREACYIVDPLKIEDLGPVWELFSNRDILKVFHAGSQDIEIIVNLSGHMPLPVFDTQVAAALLGYGQQIGFGNLVQRLLKKNLPKQESFSDWLARPLSHQQLEYAADDVIYLMPIYQQLHDELTARGRRGWLDEEQRMLCDIARYQDNPSECFRRVKGANKLKGQKLAVLQALAAWREAEAQKRDLPRRRILADEPLVELAKRDKLNPQVMERMRGLTAGIIKRFGNDILAAWQQGSRTPESEWPQFAPRSHHTSGTDLRQELLDTLVRLRAEEEKIACHILATKSDLAELASWGKNCKGEPPALPCLHGWRRELVGEDLLRLLKGEICLRMNTKTGMPIICGD
jgi:ribonuclease D